MLLEQVLSAELDDKGLKLRKSTRDDILAQANSYVLGDGTCVAHAVDEATNDYLATRKTGLPLSETIAVYAVKNENDNSLKYFAIGTKDESGEFTGVVHDYIGGGNYEEVLVYKDTIFPKLNRDGDETSWDEQVELFDSLSPFSFEQLEDNLFVFASYNTTTWNYEIDKIDFFNDGVLIHNTNLNTPYGIGNTSFVDGYEIFDYEGSFEDFKEKCCLEKTSKIAEFNTQNIETFQKTTLG